MSLVHDAAFYDSDSSFAASVVPFVQSGLSRDEPVYVVTKPRNQDILRQALGPDADVVEFIDSAEWYEAPSGTILGYLEVMKRHQEDDTRVRVVGEVDFGGTETQHMEWTRYESVLNRVFQDHPAVIMCPYDTRDLPSDVVAGARRTHPNGVKNGSRRGHSEYTRPEEFFSYVPLQPSGALIDEVDVGSDLGEVRTLVDEVGRAANLTEYQIQGLRLAVNELATNALLHGTPPVSVRGWAGAGQAFLEVTDDGPGISDLLAGFLPPSPRLQERGAGMWLARQLTDRLEIVPTEAGATVRVCVFARD